LALLILPLIVTAQMTSWFQWTFLPQTQMDEIIGESSGETAFNHILSMAGFNRDRKSDEYNKTFLEAQYVYERLKEYGFEDAEIVRYEGGQTWDGIRGELWEISPIRQKLASFTDLRAMLATGSNTADVEAELVWVDRGSREDFEGVEVKDKILITSGSVSMVHQIGCIQNGAAGVISFSSPRPLQDSLAIPWQGIRGRGENPAKFAFNIPPREGYILRDRLLAREKILVHAQVESAMQDYDIQDVVASIPGTDQNAQEVIFSAHLFEGYAKQGANDNISGCAAILEMARTLKVLIDRGAIPLPKRTIRFIWAPEYSGTIPWVNAHPEIMKRTLCNINLDMVGLGLSRSLAFMTMMRTTFGNAHYLNDVLENYYRYIGETNRTNVTNSMDQKYPRRIVAPSGSEDPFTYYMGTHMGSSDHEVFNDWGVGVPGIVMNTWPDFWFHTSEDRPDKIDPTQLKRVVVIGAATSYTIATADDPMAFRIAAEIAANAANRIGHQLARGIEELQRADKDQFVLIYKKARGYIEGAAICERATLESVAELGSEWSVLLEDLSPLNSAVNGIEKSCLLVLESQMNIRAEQLQIKPLLLSLSSLEERASKLIPIPTGKIKENGYQGYRSAISNAQKDMKNEQPTTRSLRSGNEIQLLCNGKNSALDMKKMVDTQFKQETDLQAILDHLDVLKAAGLINWKDSSSK
ncbi:M28 family peptidase, partial [Acidobacteriota bacterium]